MAQRIKAFNNAFANCIFANRESAIKTIEERIDEHDVFAEKPTAIKMQHVDDTHDRLFLTFSNGTLDGIVTWHRTKDGRQYVLSGYEVAKD